MTCLVGKRPYRGSTTWPEEDLMKTVTESPPERKTVDVPTAADMLGISARQAYALIREDRFPVPVLRLGRSVKVPTRPLLDALGVAS